MGLMHVRLPPRTDEAASPQGPQAFCSLFFGRSRHAMLASVSDFSQGPLVDDGRFSPKPRSLCAVRRKLDLEDIA